MKTSILAAAIVACALSAPIVSAQEKTVPAKPAMDMDMAKQMSQMQENMKTMQGQMDKIRKTTDPKERQKLMQDHMQSMRDGMTMMRGLGGPMMMGMMGGKPGATGPGMMGGDPKQHQEMMGRRMDMMQMMMEQMMQHDQMRQQMPAK